MAILFRPSLVTESFSETALRSYIISYFSGRSGSRWLQVDVTPLIRLRIPLFSAKSRRFFNSETFAKSESATRSPAVRGVTGVLRQGSRAHLKALSHAI